jgi:hypothetical protein
MNPLARGLLIALLLGIARPAGAQEPRLFLSWGAPHGTLGAREWVSAPCGSAARDTLYLCFDPGRARTPLIAATATLRMWPAEGDTLAPHWRFAAIPPDSLLRVELAPEAVPGAGRVWTAAGMGGARYRSTPEGGTLRMIYAVRVADADTLSGGRLYVFGRLIFARPAAGPGCDRPLCVEWQEGSLAFGENEEPKVATGVRFVGWNSRDAAVCERYRAFTPGAEPWQPGRKR